ncbi:hypothetical protein [Flavobacterium sp.]|uniref:hypothetical protein n=1 Tax=Flavobacterium sp. TaxID=239 RepID=UPI00375222DA
MTNERPVWRVVLSICITIFLVVRLIITCSKSNDNSKTIYNNSLNNIDFNKEINDNKIQYANNLEVKSNAILYLNYKEIDNISDNEKAAYMLSKFKKDSLISLDIESTIKIPKDYYFQKNYDDTLKMGFKSPKDLTVFIHDLESKNNVEEIFKSIKRGCKLEKLSIEKQSSSSKTIFYSFSKNNFKYNGYAMVIDSDGYFLFIEFESHKLSAFDLKFEALNFITTQIKSVK